LQKDKARGQAWCQNAVNLQTNLADVLKLTCLIAHILSKSLHLRFFSRAESLRRSAAI
jgi:hypothetical protein